MNILAPYTTFDLSAIESCSEIPACRGPAVLAILVETRGGALPVPQRFGLVRAGRARPAGAKGQPPLELRTARPKRYHRQHPHEVAGVPANRARPARSLAVQHVEWSPGKPMALRRLAKIELPSGSRVVSSSTNWPMSSKNCAPLSGLAQPGSGGWPWNEAQMLLSSASSTSFRRSIASWSSSLSSRWIASSAASHA
jgi:hypothetical protein